MDYKDALSTLTMSSKTTKMLGVGIAAIAFLLVTIPVFHSGVHGDNNNNCDHGDGNNDNRDSDNE